VGVLDGVLLRGVVRFAVAVRTPTGTIEVLTSPLPDVGGAWRKVPLVRGLLALAEAMPLGVRALKWSAVHGLGEPERKATPVERITQIVTVALVLAAIVTIPAYATDWLVGDLHNGLVSALVENVWSIGILVAYAAAIGRLSAVRRLFENHGAEHKVVAASEAGVELTPENAGPFSTRHVRCGTSLLLVVVTVTAVLSIVISSGLALVRPGLALQRLTTREPSPEQLEVAIVALRAAYGELDTTMATQPSSSRTVAVPA
jgi:uncharacterized protein YqhQ